MFQFTTENQLKYFLIENFSNHFNFNFVEEEHRVIGGRVDILGEDEQTIYIIELKRDFITNATILQLQNYIDNYISDKTIIGIAMAPSIYHDVDLANIPSNIWVKTIDEVSYVPNSIPYSTKIDGLLKEQLAELSKSTRIPQSKLVDEALEDLFLKYDKK